MARVEVQKCPSTGRYSSLASQFVSPMLQSALEDHLLEVCAPEVYSRSTSEQNRRQGQLKNLLSLERS